MITYNPADVVSIHPYFKVHPGKIEAFKALLPALAEKASSEEKILYYDFTVCGDVVFCREAYLGAEGLLAHLDNVGVLLGEMLKLADIQRLEVHAAAGEIEKLKGPLAGLKPEWYVFQCGAAPVGR